MLWGYAGDPKALYADYCKEEYAPLPKLSARGWKEKGNMVLIYKHGLIRLKITAAGNLYSYFLRQVLYKKIKICQI